MVDGGVIDEPLVESMYMYQYPIRPLPVQM